DGPDGVSLRRGGAGPRPAVPDRRPAVHELSVADARARALRAAHAGGRRRDGQARKRRQADRDRGVSREPRHCRVRPPGTEAPVGAQDGGLPSAGARARNGGAAARGGQAPGVAGHVSLIDAARRHGERFVASIFVNPMQFGPNEDFAHYPRTPREDGRMLAEAGCSLMFIPEVGEIYPHGSERVTRVEVPGLSRILEGEFRPGHLEGVSTVVAKLFHIVEPDVAIFGAKDFQQLAVIRRMVADLCMAVEIVAAPTVRDSDGLAM